MNQKYSFLYQNCTTVDEIAKKFKINQQHIYKQLNNGRTIEDIVKSVFEYRQKRAAAAEARGEKYEFSDNMLTLAELAEKHGVARKDLQQQILKGKSIERAIETLTNPKRLSLLRTYEKKAETPRFPHDLDKNWQLALGIKQ